MSTAAVLSETGLDEWILRHARRSLFSLFGSVEPEPSSIEASVQSINVTLRTRGKIRGSWSGRGHTLSLRIEDAVSRTALDRRFTGPIVSADLDQVDIEVWIQIAAEDVPYEARADQGVLILGIHGVEVRLGERHAYYKPSVAITSGFQSPQALMGGVCKKAGLDKHAWMDPECEVRRTVWKHLAEQRNGSVQQFQMLRPIPERVLAQADMTRWVKQGADYLVNGQEADGSFSYRYDPLSGAASPEPANTVRASGCAMAMASMCSSPYLSATESHLQTTRRAIEAIMARAIPFRDGLVIPEPKANGVEGAKLGTSALLAAAVLMPAFLQEYNEVAMQLVKTLANARDGRGLFVCTFSESGNEDRSSGIDFFPGQALLALTLACEAGLINLDFRESFLAYQQHFREKPATAFVGWHADVWSRLAVREDSSEYAAFVFEQVDWLLQSQIVNLDAGLQRGGFIPHGKPPAYSSIVYTEAVIRAAQLAQKRNEEERWMRYREHALCGLEFCSRLRLQEEQSFLFAQPDRALGAFCKSMTEFEVRSDFVQHGITMALAALEAGIYVD